MTKLIPQLWAHRYLKGFPKLSVGVAPMLISFELGVSMVIGYFVARFLAGPKPNAQGRVPSLVVRVRAHRVHVHHWLLFSPILLVLLVSHVFILTPHLFYGFLGGVIAQGVLYYDDWASVVRRG
jgi:hypothetical protein